MNAPSRLFSLAVGAVSAASLYAGCASTSTPPPRTGWTPEMSQLYNNEPAQLPGETMQQWSSSDREAFARRIGYADVAAVGMADTSQTFEGRGCQRHTVTFVAEELLHGSIDRLADPTGRIALRLDNVDDEVLSNDRLARRLSGRRFLLLLKQTPHRPQPPDDAVDTCSPSLATDPAMSYRWVMYWPNAAVVNQLRTIYDTVP